MDKFILALAITTAIGSVQIPSAFAATACSGNPHDFDSGSSGNPHGTPFHSDAPNGNPHDVGEAEGTSCPGSK